MALRPTTLEPVDATVLGTKGFVRVKQAQGSQARCLAFLQPIKRKSWRFLHIAGTPPCDISTPQCCLPFLGNSAQQKVLPVEVVYIIEIRYH